jgi:3'-phosphoadenosine 5'-phosphosulfate sulfotransferase (PAPS reductase)/FAD synthetase
VRTYHSTASRDPRPEPLLRILNLGAGTQSTAVALMHLDGTLPPIDAAVFADTQWEPQEVYTHLDRLRGTFEDAGVPLLEVTAGNIREDALNPEHRFASMPTFVKGEMSKAGGMNRRQCTSEYKIKPVRKAILGLLADTLGKKMDSFRNLPKGVYVEQVFGISLDEAQRMRSPRDRWSINYYPLIELGWRRDETIAYLGRNGWTAPRSACIGCPYRSNASWLHLKENNSAEWQDAVEFDRDMRLVMKKRDKKFVGEIYLHRSMLPLAEAPLLTSRDENQSSLFGGLLGGECEGMCGV